jgi:hypothetical protein
MFDLFHSLVGNFKFTFGRSIGLLDKAVQHHEALTDRRAIKNTGGALSAFEAQLKQAFFHGLGVRLTQIGSDRQHAAGQHDVPGGQGIGQFKDLFLNAFAAGTDFIVRR